jgi:hypothetical protein
MERRRKKPNGEKKKKIKKGRKNCQNTRENNSEEEEGQKDHRFIYLCIKRVNKSNIEKDMRTPSYVCVCVYLFI